MINRTDFSQRIVCAACRVKRTNNFTGLVDFIVIPSVRHFDKLACAILDNFQCSQNYSFDETSMEQGFVDNFGRFLTRKEANIIAKEKGQKLWTTGDDDTLYSEDLY